MYVVNTTDEDSHEEGKGWGGEFRWTRERIQYAPVTSLGKGLAVGLYMLGL
jgi:hypothetical protein